MYNATLNRIIDGFDDVEKSSAQKMIEATLETKLISSDHCDPLLSHPNSVLTSHAFEILRAVLALILLYL